MTTLAQLEAEHARGEHLLAKARTGSLTPAEQEEHLVLLGQRRERLRTALAASISPRSVLHVITGGVPTVWQRKTSE